MASVGIGQVAVNLVVNTAKWKDGWQEAAGISDRQMREIQRSAEAAGKAIGVAFAAAATGVVALTRHAINAADDMNDLAQKTGISTKALSTLTVVAKQSGANVEVFGSSVAKLSKNAAAAAGGVSSYAKVFAAMGVSVVDTSGKLKPTEAIFSEVSKKFAGYKDGAEKTALAQALFGKSGADLIPMLNSVGAGVEQTSKYVKAFGAEVTPEAARQADEFNDNLELLKLAATGFGNQLAEKALPSLNNLSVQMLDNAEKSGGLTSVADGLADVLKSVAKAAILVKTGVEIATNYVAAAIDVFAAFKDSVGDMFGSIGHQIAGVAKAASSDFAGASAEFQAAGKTMGDGFDGMRAKVKAAVESASTGVEDAKANAVSLLEALDKPANQFANVIGGVGPIAEQATAPVVQLGEDATETAKKVKDLSDQHDRFVAQTAAMAAALDGPLAEAQDKYRAGIVAAASALAAGVISQDEFVARQEVLEEQLTRTTEELAEQADVLGRYMAQVNEERAAIGMSARQKAVAAAVKKVTDEYKGLEQSATKAGLKMAQPLEDVQAAAADAAGGLWDAQESAASLEAILSNYGKMDFRSTLVASIEEVSKALDTATDKAKIERMQRALVNMNSELRDHNLALISQGVNSLQKFAKEGTAAYTALGIAQDILAYKSAVAAIATQGEGDPYTAFARIAAMIALMASIGIRVSGGGGGAPSAQSAEARQARQGTGTVLGDASAKSESIARAVEITANATQQLVGINRGMLRALQSLQQALGAAGVSLARGAGNADFAPLQDNVGALFGTSDSFDHAVNDFFFGGSQEVIDQGIIIAGGALQDMINQMAIGAYQTIEENGGLFGSDSTFDQMGGVSEAFGRQFQLVIGSIVDAVREGATALGMLPADIEAAIAQYRVEEIRISLKGLSAEDQQKELEAVFSSIFDGLAGAVVPFIEQFQQVGEGLGETLVRVATEVQITQEAFKQLGMVVNETDPERFAQIADGLVTAAGGIDDFISGLQQFVSSFASDAQQFRVAQDALTSAFEQYGLALPATRDGMYALMQSLDATTEAGREQIATLLRLAQTADSYYSLLDKAQADAIKQIEDAIDTLSEFGVGVGEGGNKLRAISQSAIDAVKAANLLAQAAGQQGAAEWQLALIHRVAATRAAEAIAQLMSATAEMVSNFYSGDYAGDADAASSAVRGFGDAMADAAQQASDAIRLLLGDLSPLNDQAKLQVALQALQRGEVGREDVLQIGRRLYASSQAYTDLFNRVMAMAVPTTGGSDSASVGADALAGASKSPEQIARERMDLAMQIAQNVATLSNAQGETFDSIAGMLHLNLADIADAMGLTNDDLTSYLENLVDQENRTPDSVKEGADRIIAAMYDIAGRAPPDLYQVPQGDYSIPTGGAKSAAAEVRDLLSEILEASRSGNATIADAVRDNADATRGVGDMIRSVDQTAMLDGRRGVYVAR